MKTRNGLVSNSSSTSFIINTKNIKDEELYETLMSVINDNNYIAPRFDDKSSIYVCTGMSDGNQCLYKWWEIEHWLDDHHIDYEYTGDGCPEPEQKVCDFICYMTESNTNAPDPEKVKKVNAWINGTVTEELDRAAEKIGLTREDVLKDIKSGDKNFTEIYKEILGI